MFSRERNLTDSFPTGTDSFPTGTDSFPTGTVQVSYFLGFHPRKYTQPFLIPHARRAGALLGEYHLSILTKLLCPRRDSNPQRLFRRQ